MSRRRMALTRLWVVYFGLVLLSHSVVFGFEHTPVSASRKAPSLAFQLASEGALGELNSPRPTGELDVRPSRSVNLAGGIGRNLFDSLRSHPPIFFGQNETNVGVSCCFLRCECGLTVVCLPRVDG